MAKISHTKIKQPSFGEKRPKLTYTKISRFTVWGCITWYDVGTLCQVNGSINAEKYISVLDSQLWPVIARHFPDDSYVFQDDNAPVHRARIVERNKHDNNIHGMVWPAQSLDINVIENCWLRMGFTYPIPDR